MMEFSPVGHTGGYAPPQLCCESGSVQASPVRRFLVLPSRGRTQDGFFLRLLPIPTSLPYHVLLLYVLHENEIEERLQF
jgi:hypothetical protein